MTDVPDNERNRIRSDLTQKFESTLDQRIERYLAINHQKMTSNPCFAAASAECIRLYMDGHFISTVMMTQAVGEGIRKFIVERNGIQPGDGKNGEDVVADLQRKGIITQECANAFNQIRRSFRDDVHHMNPKVVKIPFPDIAERNISDLALIESEIFAVRIVNGAISPQQPMYWDISDDGTTSVYLRCSP
jgi:hypothetical protein